MPMPVRKQGEATHNTMRRTAAEQLAIPEHTVAVSSTGIIGLDMPMNHIIPNIPKLKLEAGEEAVAAFNESI
ncbi:bifunctional ornithine acetyltransferase/N-acetylglutamate synthase [Lentibacillus sp. CBA3610]|uniref:bifunctional ornithine acetyltransferase/N-acetylglutamate synthase n=1 Tax=Lentibacillus sp. CBA3610 TaxID=2518176 RepID=UPI0020D200C9|nr:bifunctional ornithine acetyltransferase/N-acetylglutamate synthase [Lentibacillus sp. CBA3610]